MGYQISYANGGMKKHLSLKGNKTLTKSAMLICTILAFLACLLLLRFEAVQQILLPGNPLITKRAIENLIFAIGSGSNLGDAVTAFCQEIILNA